MWKSLVGQGDDVIADVAHVNSVETEWKLMERERARESENESEGERERESEREFVSETLRHENNDYEADDEAMKHDESWWRDPQK